MIWKTAIIIPIIINIWRFRFLYIHANPIRKFPFQCFYCKWNWTDRKSWNPFPLPWHPKNIQYAIQIYKNPTAGDLTSGIAVLDRAQSGVTTYCGYYTIPLNTEIVFNQGDRIFRCDLLCIADQPDTVCLYRQKQLSEIPAFRFQCWGLARATTAQKPMAGWISVISRSITASKHLRKIQRKAATEILANVSLLFQNPLIRKIKAVAALLYGFPGMRYRHADGYQIFRSTSRKKGYTLIADTKRLLIPTILSFPAGNTTTGYVPMPEAATTILYTVLFPGENQTLKPEKHRYAPWKRAAKPTFWAGEKSPVLMAMKFSGRFPAKMGTVQTYQTNRHPETETFSRFKRDCFYRVMCL